MYKGVEALQRVTGRTAITRARGDFGPPAAGDDVSVKLADDVLMYVSVYRFENGSVYGVIRSFEPHSITEYRDLKINDKVAFPETSVTCLIRKD